MELIKLDNEIKMSSKEIAELCNKNHADVMRDIRNIEEQLGQSIFEQSSYINSQNKEQPMYLLNKENTLLLVSGYSVHLRLKIIKRLQEIEDNIKPKTPQTYLEALKELVIITEEKERLQSLNNALMHVVKTYTTGEIAKEIGFKSASQLNKLLHNKGIQYKQNGTWLLYSKYADMGLVEIKQGVKNDHAYYNQQWTQKGRQFILALFGAV